jgi:fatty acid desaturase
MPPNVRPLSLIDDTSALDALTELLDKQADNNGLKNINYDNEDWTDVKHSERKKRDRILDDGILLSLIKKSDYKGFERLFTNLSIMALTAYAIHRTQVFPLSEKFEHISVAQWTVFIPFYFFYGFQFQCFAFAGQHEFLHRNAFKTKWINDACLFLVGFFCFELGAHERVMHKQHHTYTNNIDRDPELTSYYTREQLNNPGFRNIPLSRMAYLRQFIDVFSTFKCRVGRIIMSSLGIAVDYSGTGWSLSDFKFSDDSGIMREIQKTALAQLAFYSFMVARFGQTQQGLESLLFWWFVPVLVGYSAINYVRNLEHSDCEVSKTPNCLKNTRTVDSNLLIRVLLWDTNFHAEHHCYPMVPFFNLHKIHEIMGPHVIGNDCHHFTGQQIMAIKPGGWIDKQSRDMAEYAAAARAKVE